MTHIEGRWIFNRGALRSPSDCTCKRHIAKGEWYWRDRWGVFCRECLPDTMECLLVPCTWTPEECPFEACVRRTANPLPGCRGKAPT